MMMEVEAFQEIHGAWRRLGYPFDSLVPSYATAIGSSADNPAGLAELVGILLNDGVRLPTVRVEWLHFAEGTPYETLVKRGRGEGERVLPKEVAEVARRALVDVVENGTARRGRGAFRRRDGTLIQLGGKTGTGDHRYETYSPAGQLISRRVMNRTATFVFFIGDRHFGAVTAFVPGAEAASYEFTSALPVQLLKSLAPALMPLLESPSQEIPRVVQRAKEVDPAAGLRRR
jgi:membrane peptidoglycan carboxypeptidase